MNPAFNNFLTWNLQLGLVIAIAAAAVTALRVRLPRAKLLVWQAALAACFVLPFLRSWKQETIVFSGVLVSRSLAGIRPPTPDPVTLSAASVLLYCLPYLLAIGCIVRFAWLLTGFRRMHTYRRGSVPLIPDSPWSAEADLRISTHLASPVTFGLRHPVVLLPAGFPQMEESVREAILCHEILHVRRKDWLFTVVEEFVRTILWFNPAIWWMLGEIQLAREQAVDREAIEMTRSRDEYVDALLVIAGATPQLDLALASLFLRRRHLKHRLFSILKEVRMSKTKTVSAVAASLVLLAASCWFVTGAIPLYGAPQMVEDAAGVAVETNGAALLHRGAISYPSEAVAKRIEGVVTVQVKLDGTGNVIDAGIVSGPDELRKSVLQSVLSWHFSHDAANSTRQITVSFQAPVQNKNAPVAGRALPAIIRSTLPQPALPPGENKLKSISVTGLSDRQRDELLAQLPVREGDPLTPDMLSKVFATVHAYDEHLIVRVGRMSPGDSTLRISTPESGLASVMQNGQAMRLEGAPPPPPPPPPPYISSGQRIGANVMQQNLIDQTKPIYPPLAKAARVQGVVSFEAVIAAGGTVRNLRVISGPPLLVAAAQQAVSQWIYKPTLLNGNPVEVVTTIDVNFTLSQ